MKYLRILILWGGLGLALGSAIGHVPSSQEDGPLAHNIHGAAEASRLQDSQLHRLAEGITVKVETPQTQGSGVIVRRISGRYWVITNEHVALESDRLTIYTADGKRHGAKRVSQAQFGQADLTLLEFQSRVQTYPVAQLASGLQATPGSSVFSAGFPLQRETVPFRVTQGKVLQIISRGLNGGYQVGYSNWVPKGMSGGPVLNLQGQVIAINGIHSEPLWGNPYRWDDGSIPSDPEVEELAKLSWAIPTETILQGMPQ